MERRKHFVLVHGMSHGAWCWYKVSTLLQEGGHRVSAVDLGGCGVNPRRLDEIGSMTESLDPLMKCLGEDDDEKVVLVGHSYGGLAVSLAMETFHHKISAAVFISAYMPNYKHPPATQIQQYFESISFESMMDCKFSYDKGLEKPPTSAIMGPKYLATTVYKHCQLEDLELAKMLVRPNGFFIEDMSHESLLTEERFGLVNRVYIVCQEDEVMKEEFQQWVIMNSPPKEVKSIPAAGHMVMLSKPKELCLCLEEIANKYS